MTITDRRLAAIATGQLGIVTRAQAREAGLSDRQLQNRVQSGSLVRMGVDAFRFAGSPRTVRSDVLALVLDIGGDVRVSGPTAAALFGFDGFVLRAPFHLTVGRGRCVSRVGHVVHTTSILPPIDRAIVDGVPVTSAARTLIDLARMEPPDRLTLALDSGLRDGRFSEDLLHRRIVALRSSGRFGIPRLLDVIDGAEVSRGGHSWLEREFLRLVAAAGLPRPMTQVVLGRARHRMVRVDVRFPGTPEVVELLGYRFHRSSSQLRRDADRLNALVRDGLEPYQFTYAHVVEEPEQMLDDLRQALRVADQPASRRVR
jgi:hypothetical protein